LAVCSEAVLAQQPDDCLRRVATPERDQGQRRYLDLRVEVATLEAWPVDQRQGAGQRLLRPTHPRRKHVRVAVRPAHASARATRREVRPLDVTEALVVEALGQRASAILEDMDWSVLTVQERALVSNLVERRTG